MSRRTRMPWEATRSLPIWDQRKGDFTNTALCRAPHTYVRTHTLGLYTRTMYQCNEKRQISFSFGNREAQKLHKYVHLWQVKKTETGNCSQLAGWLLLPLQSFSIQMVLFKWILRLRHVPLWSLRPQTQHLVTTQSGLRCGVHKNIVVKFFLKNWKSEM